MKASIDDVARHADVSTATVSRVLNNNGPISASTRSAVQKAIEELNYIPRGAGLRKSKALNTVGRKVATGTLELVFCLAGESEVIEVGAEGLEVTRGGRVTAPDFFLSDAHRYGSSFFRSISEGVIEEARRYGYRTVVHSIDKTRLADPALIQTLVHDGADGLLLAGEHPEDISALLAKCPIPVVLVDIIANEGPVEVTTDNLEGMILAFQHIYELGHRDIGFAFSIDIPEYRERYNSFAFKMAEKQLSINNDWVYRGANHVLDVGAWAEKMLASPNRPTAFLCTNDYAALGILRGAVNAGLKVPEELSIVGFDDIETSQVVTPSLTSVRVPKEEIGRASVRELLVSLQGDRQEFGAQCRMRISPVLVERESTCRPKDRK